MPRKTGYQPRETGAGGHGTGALQNGHRADHRLRSADVVRRCADQARERQLHRMADLRAALADRSAATRAGDASDRGQSTGSAAGAWLGCSAQRAADHDVDRLLRGAAADQPVRGGCRALHRAHADSAAGPAAAGRDGGSLALAGHRPGLRGDAGRAAARCGRFRAGSAPAGPGGPALCLGRDRHPRAAWTSVP